MAGITQRENAPTGKRSNLLTVRQYSNNVTAISCRHPDSNVSSIESARHFVDNQRDARHTKAAQDVNGDSSALIVALIVAQQNRDNVRRAEGQQGFFIQAGVRIYQQGAEAESFNQSIKPIIKQMNIVVAAQGALNVGQIRAGRDEIDCASHISCQTQARCEINNGLLDLAVAPQKIIERIANVGVSQAEENSLTRGSQIHIHDADGFALQRQQRGDIGSEIRFAHTTAKGMD